MRRKLAVLVILLRLAALSRQVVAADPPKTKDIAPLLQAIQAGRIVTALALAQQPGNVNVADAMGKTALMYAADIRSQQQRSALVERLLDFGATVNLQDRPGMTALMYAARHEDAETIRVLLDHGAEVGLKDQHKRTALGIVLYPIPPEWRAGTRSWHVNDQAAFALIIAGADVKGKTSLGDSYLAMAAQCCAPEVVEAMILRGADVNAPNKYGSAAYAAAFTNNVSAMQVLLEHGARINTPDAPMMLAAQNGHLDMVELLLAHGADVNLEHRDDQRTALMAAASMLDERPENLVIMQRLLDHRANVNLRDHNGWSALTWAALSGSVTGVKLLLNHGADATIRDHEKKTLLTMVNESGHSNPSMIALLERYGARK